MEEREFYKLKRGTILLYEEGEFIMLEVKLNNKENMVINDFAIDYGDVTGNICHLSRMVPGKWQFYTVADRVISNLYYKRGDENDSKLCRRRKKCRNK